MSIYIKGMEMPTSCGDCWALDDYGDYPRCRITEEQRGYNFPIRQKRMDKCPLINDAPTIEIEPVRHGKWISHGSFVTCSVCNEEQYGIDTGRFYCQNCGAKMDNEVE